MKNGIAEAYMAALAKKSPKLAQDMLESGKLDQTVDARYAKWKEPQNAAMLAGKESLEQIAARVHKSALEPQPASGRQEYLEGLLNIAE